MTLINLKFSPEMARAALAGQKCCTSRREAKGKPGDEFEIKGVRFRVLTVQSVPLASIFVDLYGCEGFPDPSSCASAIRAIYPVLDLVDSLHVHFFARCP